MASYPSSVFVVTTHLAGDIIQPADVNNCEIEIAAIEAGLLNGYAHTTFPVADATYDLGKSAFRFKNLYSDALQALDVAARVNYLEVDAAATGNPVIAQAKGTDATVNLNVGTKGGAQLKLIDVAALVNYLQVSGKATGGAPDLRFTGADATVGGTIGTKGGTQITFVDVASMVNFLQIAAAATGGTPALTGTGTDSNVGLLLNTKGTGSQTFQVNSVTVATMTAANDLRLVGALSAGSVTATAVGAAVL